MGPMRDKRKRIFISYSAEDESAAQWVRQGLSSEFDIVSGDQIEAGKTPLLQIASQIQNADGCVALLPIRPSTWVSWELAALSAVGKPIVFLAKRGVELRSPFIELSNRLIPYENLNDLSVLRRLEQHLGLSLGAGESQLPERRFERFEKLVEAVFIAAGFLVSRSAGTEADLELQVPNRTEGPAFSRSVAALVWLGSLQRNLSLISAWGSREAAEADGPRFLVECKVSNRPLDRAAILSWAKMTRSLTKKSVSPIILVTNGSIGPSAKSAAGAKGLLVLDGQDLLRLGSWAGVNAHLAAEITTYLAAPKRGGHVY